jgi:hypothetical protein
VLVWLVTLMWLSGEASMACVYPDLPAGGCPVDEVSARLRFDRWFGPVLLAGPIATLAIWAWLGEVRLPGSRLIRGNGG